MRLFVISALVIAFLAILFALQNTNLVTIQFFLWQYQHSLALVLLGTLAIGVVIGLLVSFPVVIRRNLKLGRLQKQFDTLTTLLQEKEQALATAAQKTEAVKQTYGNLLKALGLIEPVTGLLRDTLLEPTLERQLQTLSQQGTAGQTRSLSLLLFQVKPQDLANHPPEVVFSSVAHLLQQQASIATWCYSDGQGRFAATVPNLDMQATTRYSETLQSTLLEQLPSRLSTPITVDISIGGAMAELTPTLSAQTLVATAQTALEQALSRGRNRLQLLTAA